MSRLSQSSALQGHGGLALQAHGTALRVVPRPPYEPQRRLARPVRLPAMLGAPRAEQAKRVANTPVAFVIDDSGSLYFGAGGDTTGVRYAAALSLLGLIRRAGGGNAAVVHYGSNAPEELATPPLDAKRDWRQLKQALTIPVPNLGGTNVASGLARCAEALAGAGPGDPVVYIVGDGIEAVSATARQALEALPPNSAHLLLVDRSGACDAALEAGWRSLPLASIERLEVFDAGAMAWQLAEIFASSIGLQMPSQARRGRKRRQR